MSLQNRDAERKAAEFVEKNFCKKHGALDLVIGVSRDITEKKMSDIFLRLAGLDPAEYETVFRGSEISALRMNFTMINDRGELSASLRFRFFEKKSGEVTGEQCVPLFITKLFGRGGETVCPFDTEAFEKLADEKGREDAIKNCMVVPEAPAFVRPVLPKLTVPADDKAVFYFVRDGKAVTTIIRPASASKKEYAAAEALAAKIFDLSGVLVRVRADDDPEITGSPFLFGDTLYHDPAIMGEATSYQYVIHRGECALSALGRTPRGHLRAIKTVTDSLVCGNCGRDVYLTADILGIHDSAVPPVRHAFERFTVSLYGCPYNQPEHSTPEGRLDDLKTFRDVVAFRTDEFPFTIRDVFDDHETEINRKLIKRYYEQGIKIRPYCALHTFEEEFLNNGGHSDALDRYCKKLTEGYADLDAIAQWGFYDEPKEPMFSFCRGVIETMEKYDPKKRPVYVNLDPTHEMGRGDSIDFYDAVSDKIAPAYYCYDRYPFFVRDGVPGVYDDNYYRNLEINRDYGIEDSVDTGMIFAAIRVGGEPDDDRSDVDDDMMRWESHLLLAYGMRYYEQYVYYHVHDFSILTDGNEPTHRWYRAQRANAYLSRVGKMLDSLRLDAVFHLPDKDGSYSAGVTPYYGFRGLGAVGGCDAVLSFFEDGTLILTDKRSGEKDGGTHELTFENLKADDLWLEPLGGKWKPLSECPGARFDGTVCTLEMPRACQYIFRRK